MAFSGKYKVAELIFSLTTIYPYTHELLKEYAFDGDEDFSLEIFEEDIDFERKKSRDEALFENKPVIEYQPFYLESLAVLRKLSDVALDYDRILFHGSSLELDGEGYVFTAKSGTGKSTHTSYWRETFGEKCRMINDDKPIIHVSDNPVIFGTCWDGKHHLSSNAKAELKYICILMRGEHNEAQRITKSEAFGMILQQTLRPKSPEKMTKLLTLIDKLLSSVPAYNIWCNLDKSSAREIYDKLKG